MVKNLIFDFGRVLVDYDFESLVDTFFDDKQQLGAFKKVIVSDEFINQLDRELVPFAEFISQTQRQYPQWRTELQLFHDQYLDFVTGEVPGMRDLLLQFKSEGYRLIGLTNWNSVVYDVIRKFDILQILDGQIISSEEHLLKPEEAIYLRLLERFGLNAEECLFTDDKPANILGAQKVGIRGIVFQNAKQYQRELKKILESGETEYSN